MADLPLYVYRHLVVKNTEYRFMFFFFNVTDSFRLSSTEDPNENWRTQGIHLQGRILSCVCVFSAREPALMKGEGGGGGAGDAL